MNIVLKEEYWTTILNDLSQHGQITTEDVKFNEIAEYVWRVLQNTLILTEDEKQIKHWEEIVNVSGEGLTQFQRKVNLLYILTTKNYLPIGLFKNSLDKIVGKDKYTLNFNEENNEYEITYDNNRDWSKIKFIKDRLTSNDVILEDGNTLPEGYIPAEFLEYLNTNSYVQIPLTNNGNSYPGFEVLHDLQYTSHDVGGFMGVGGGSYDFWRVVNSTTFGFETNKTITVDDIKNRRKIIFAIQDKISYLSTEGKTTSAYRSSDRGDTSYYLFFVPPYSNTMVRIFNAKVTEGGILTRNLRPALSPEGRVCFYDLISKTVFEARYKNCLKIGFSDEQFKQLDRFPASSNNITISLHEGYEEKEDIVKILNDLRAKGWTITVQTYTDEEISYFLRNRFTKMIWVRKIQNENGFYGDANGICYDVDWCVEIYSPENLTPENYGYEQFYSFEDAIQTWQLSPYINSDLEKSLNEKN